MPAALIALAAIQTGFSMYSQQQQLQAAKRAERQATDRSIANQNQMVMEGYKRRRENVDALSSSSMAQNASQQGTILTGSSTQRSLLG
jgi:hypothetical protein